MGEQQPGALETPSFLPPSRLEVSGAGAGAVQGSLGPRSCM